MSCAITPDNGGGKRKVSLVLKLEAGHAVGVAGSFNDWDPGTTPMVYDAASGSYLCELELPAGCYEYKFVIDDEWKLDETNPNFASNDFGTLNSVLNVE